MRCLKKSIAITLIAVSATLSAPALSQTYGTANLLDNSSPAWFVTQPNIETINVDGKSIKYTAQFNRQLAQDKFGWTTSFQIMRPGLYHFVLYPKDAKHLYSSDARKLMVPVYGQDGDWPQYKEMKTQIFPLTTPYDQAAQNKFSAQVFLNGQPAVNSVVAVEYYGADNYQSASSSTKIITLVRTNRNGVFTFDVPWQGWWGFVALNDYNSLSMNADGSPIELGSVLWTKFVKP